MQLLTPFAPLALPQGIEPRKGSLGKNRPSFGESICTPRRSRTPIRVLIRHRESTGLLRTKSMNLTTSLLLQVNASGSRSSQLVPPLGFEPRPQSLRGTNAAVTPKGNEWKPRDSNPQCVSVTGLQPACVSHLHRLP